MTACCNINDIGMPNSLGFVNSQPQRPKVAGPPNTEGSEMRPEKKCVTIDDVKPCSPGQKKCYKIVLKVRNKKKKPEESAR